MNTREYTITISGVASPGAAFDFLEVSPAANKPVLLRRILIMQTSEATSEEEQLALTVIRGYTASGSGGDTTPDGGALTPGAAAYSFTAETMNTTGATTGTPVNLVEAAWNTRAGLDLAFAPEEAPSCINGLLLVIRSAAPADAVTIRATFWLAEIA